MIITNSTFTWDSVIELRFLVFENSLRLYWKRPIEFPHRWKVHLLSTDIEALVLGLSVPRQVYISHKKVLECLENSFNVVI